MIAAEPIIISTIRYVVKTTTVETPIKTKRFFRFFNDFVKYSVLEKLTDLITLLQNEFRKITGIIYIPAIRM